MPKADALLRLATEGRVVLCGMHPAMQDSLREHTWRAHGDLTNESVLILSVAENGLKLAKDGRLFIPDGQKELNVREELDLRWSTSTGTFIAFSVEGRQPPSPSKILSMANRPVKPPTIKVDPNQNLFFEELTPNVRTKRKKTEG